MLLSRGGRAIRFPESDVGVVGRTAQGVKGMALQGDDEVVGMLLIRREADVLTVTDDGAGKRTPVAEFPLQKRGGMGTLAVPSGATSGVVCAIEVLDGEEVMVISAGGSVTRVAVCDVPVQGRRTQGRRIVSLAPGDRVVEVTRTQDRSTRNPSSPPESAGAERTGGEDGQLDLLGS